jgi:hypothetical protein
MSQSQPERLTPIEFVKAKLKLNPDASFADIKAQARVEGINVYPVVYGRAKALLGLVPTAPYGSKSKARKEAEAASRGPEATAPPPLPLMPTPPSAPSPAPPRAAGFAAGGDGARTSKARVAASARNSGSALSSFEEMIGNLKTAVEERDRYRETLEKIAELIREELER